jgi:hypothetical protein
MIIFSLYRDSLQYTFLSTVNLSDITSAPALIADSTISAGKWICQTIAILLSAGVIFMKSADLEYFLCRVS